MCVTPELPVFDGSAVPSSQPVRCVKCGEEIYLACGPDSISDTITHPTKQQLHRRTVKYAPKPCARCLRTFDPKGPRSLYCDRADCTTPKET